MSTTPSLPDAPPEPANPRAGKRLSFGRVLLAVTVVVVIAAGAVFGFHFFVVDQARASSQAPFFAGYVDTTLTPQYAFEDPANASQKNVVLSFVVAGAATECTPSWGGAYTLDAASQSIDLDRRIARLRQVGGDPIVSFGGAINTDLATACTSVGDLSAAYQTVVDRYQLSTIDLDVEGVGLTDAAVGERRAEAIAALQAERRKAGKDLAVWLTLPVMPTGLTADGTRQIAQFLAAGVDLTGVNIMTMDYGIDLKGESMGQAAIDALNATHDQLATAYNASGTQQTDATLWAKLGATPMIGQNDVAGEVFSLDDASQLNAFAQQKQLGRLSEWSLNRDQSCSPNYIDVTTVSNLCSGVDQGDKTFAEVLAGGFDASSDGDSVVTATPTVAPSSAAPAAPGRASGPAADDPATSPYPIWSATATYLAGAKIVWHGNVYEAKWWTQGDTPDDPVKATTDTPWSLVGPVLPGETPYVVPTLPPGTYPNWSGTTVYTAGDRVLLDGVPYQAKWWTQGDSPAATTAKDPDGSPWLPLTAAQVAQIAAGTATGQP
ncbi:chitinase [Subtercola endophyticus]|uniref:chitinase n=1 Tax=Subtercola endophyticus TaxID=2895559 RepID=UPI001E520A0E|nr:carbohydrate-binding protein [Subtercola endophyticus]UFS57837.1 carbohydrate-binding protein [Subtercola endophyticus]